MKITGSTRNLLLKLKFLSEVEDRGIPGVEVKFVDIRRNTRGEGDDLDRY